MLNTALGPGCMTKTYKKLCPHRANILAYRVQVRQKENSVSLGD